MDIKKMSFLFKEYGAVKTLIIFSLFLISVTTQAAVKEYHETENEGLYKDERWSTLEKHLIELTNAFNKLESKVEENSKAIKGLEEKAKTVKVSETATPEVATGPKANGSKKVEDELKKLNADILVIKDKDIERMKEDIRQLFISVKILQERTH